MWIYAPKNVEVKQTRSDSFSEQVAAVRKWVEKWVLYPVTVTAQIIDMKVSKYIYSVYLE